MSGAAADVAAQRGNSVGLGNGGATEEKAGQGDHESGRAESALDRAFLKQGLLNRAEVRLVEAFDAHDMASIHVAQREQAGVDRPIEDPVRLRDAEQDHACSAVAFAAAVLGSREPEVVPQDIQERGPATPGNDLFPIVENKKFASHC